MEVQTTLTTVISIFLLLLAGYAAKRFGALKPGDSVVVNSIVINLTMPAFIFIYTHGKPITSGMVKAPALGFAMEMVVMGVAYLAARAMRMDRRTTGAFMLVSTFGNTGFLGYPVVSAAFHGHKGAVLTAVMFDEFAMAMILNSIGVAVAAAFAGSKFEWGNLLEFLKTPLFPATIVALILKDVPMPSLLMKTLGYLAAGTVPLAMISIGLSLSTGTVKEYPKPIAVAFVLKMAMLPALMYFILPFAGVTGIVSKVVVLESAMPSAVFSGVVAARYGANGAFAAGAIFLMTLASVLVIPGILLLIQ